MQRRKSLEESSTASKRLWKSSQAEEFGISRKSPAGSSGERGRLGIRQRRNDDGMRGGFLFHGFSVFPALRSCRFYRSYRFSGLARPAALIPSASPAPGLSLRLPPLCCVGFLRCAFLARPEALPALRLPPSPPPRERAHHERLDGPSSRHRRHRPRRWAYSLVSRRQSLPCPVWPAARRDGQPFARCTGPRSSWRRSPCRPA
jgi:hypothetical protein